jgi:hypothetical protein
MPVSTSTLLTNAEAASLARVPLPVWEHLKSEGALGTVYNPSTSGGTHFDARLLRYVIASAMFTKMRTNALHAYNKGQQQAVRNREEELIKLGTLYEKQLAAGKREAISRGAGVSED